MFSNITEARIISVFKTNYLGDVHHVDFVPKKDKNGKPYNAAYVHFARWYDNNIVSGFQDRIRNDKQARVAYDDPWFWIALENTGVKAENPDKVSLVSSDYAALLEKKLADAEKRLEELEESSWERISELEERVLVLEKQSHLVKSE
jgi:hypothetical protein